MIVTRPHSRSQPLDADGVGKPPVNTLDVGPHAKWRPMATTATADGVGRHQVAIAGSLVDGVERPAVSPRVYIL